MDRQAALRVRDGADLGVDVDRAGVCCGSGPVCGADYREPTVVTLQAGAEYARPEPPKGARLHPLRIKIDRLQAEAQRVARNPVGDWKEVIAQLNRLADVCERQLAHNR